ncbi:MAG: FIG187021: hypothetical protein, partial [uncultured Blastococcus sp.]
GPGDRTGAGRRRPEPPGTVLGPWAAAGSAAAAAHRHLVGAEDLAGPVDRAVLHLDGRRRRAVPGAQRARRLRHPQRAVRPAGHRGRRGDHQRGADPGHRLRWGGHHRRHQRRAAHGAVHRGHVHLQHVLGPRRRPRGHPLRAGL